MAASACDHDLRDHLKVVGDPLDPLQIRGVRRRHSLTSLFHCMLEVWATYSCARSRRPMIDALIALTAVEEGQERVLPMALYFHGGPGAAGQSRRADLAPLMQSERPLYVLWLAETNPDAVQLVAALWAEAGPRCPPSPSVSRRRQHCTMWPATSLRLPNIP